MTDTISYATEETKKDFNDGKKHRICEILTLEEAKRAVMQGLDDAIPEKFYKKYYESLGECTKEEYVARFADELVNNLGYLSLKKYDNLSGTEAGGLFSLWITDQFEEVGIRVYGHLRTIYSYTFDLMKRVREIAQK